MDARLQLFDFKTTYKFNTVPGIDKYNMPLYNMQTEQTNQSIGMYPVYQGFLNPCFVNGIQVPFYTEPSGFWNLWPNYVQDLNPAAVGDGTAGPYTISTPFFPCLPGHVDISGIIATGNNQDPPQMATGANLLDIPVTSSNPGVYFTATDDTGFNIIVQDSGIFLNSASNNGDLYGILVAPGNAPDGNGALPGGYSVTSNTINYNTGVANITFPSPIPAGANIQAACYFYEQGIPRAILFYNNTITLRAPPNTQYVVEMTAYLSPAAFMNTAAALPFAYMAEYIARGAARKILSDTGDVEQLQFYEPFFREQEMLVWKRSQRQFTASRTGTLFSETQGQTNWNNIGMGTN